MFSQFSIKILSPVTEVPLFVKPDETIFSKVLLAFDIDLLYPNDNEIVEKNVVLKEENTLLKKK